MMQSLQISFVLNRFKCQSSNATLLRNNWVKVQSILLVGQVLNTMKQLIICNVSKERGLQAGRRVTGACFLEA
ncbi:hypothetical protein ACMA1I_13860 [Pontibacter sp. 13R65]|uniref:hypothetical protein n=1 Tax=Pontibacter sp. 13R65 TaxID=3127458 RepID=UPI00301D6EF0